jgi:hypothetical protein
MDASVQSQTPPVQPISDPQMDVNKTYQQDHERPQQVSDDQPIQLASNVPPAIPTADTHNIVAAPDGSKVAFPKETPQLVMQDQMSKWWTNRVQNATAAWDSVRHAATNAAQAIGLPSDMPEWQAATDEFMRDPISKSADVVGALIGGLAHGANSVIPNTPENKALAARAQAAWERGDHLAAATTLTPLIGDGLAKAVKQAQDKDFSGSIGTTLGVAAPFVSGELGVKLPTTDLTPWNALGQRALNKVGLGVETPAAAEQAAAYAGEERRVAPADYAGAERRGALMSPTQIETNLKTGQPVTTPFDSTEGAMDTINRDLASRLETKPRVPTPEEDTAFFNKKEAEANKVSVDELSDRPDKKIVSIKVGGKRAGQISLTPMPDLGDGAMEVSTAQLKPEFQGKGHGTEAYKQVIDYAREKGANSLYSDDQVSPQADRVWQSLKDRGIATADQTTGRYKIDLSPERAGTDEGAAKDSDLFAQAKAKLGADASFSEVAQEAQRMKITGEADPMVVRHWSKQREPLTETDPAKFGTGRAGEETKRANEPGFLPRTYFGMEGYREPAIQSGLEHTATLDRNKFYDVNADPKGIWQKAYAEGGATAAEKAVKDAGYSGYYSPEQQVAASFDKVPVKVRKGPVAEAADSFNAEHGRPPVEHVAAQPSKFAKIIADEYDKLRHNPNDPAVQKAYGALRNDINDQWNYATDKMGIKFEPWDKEGQPYANSKEMAADVKNNKHLYFFTGGDLPADHPLMAVDPETGFNYNEKLRAVHDLFGHAANENQFGPAGEERAWREHAQMFSPEAVPAVTTETRGQNSWTNFGKHLRDQFGNLPNKGDAGYISPAARPYAENKAAILPEWTHRPEGAPPSKTNPWAANYNPWTADYEKQMQRQIADLHNTEGGSTYNPRMGDMNGKDAFAVPAHPELSKVYEGTQVTPSLIESYMKEPKVAAALAADPALSVGTWANEGKTYLDLSVTIPDREQAIALGKANNQIAIRDLKNGVDINTGGTGTPTILDEPNVGLKDLWSDETGTYTSGAFMRYLAKNKLLSKAGKDTLETASKDKVVPGWAEVSQFLTPEDRAATSASVQRNVVDLVNKFDPKWVEDAAKAGSAAKGWYSRATALIQHMFGDEAHRFTNFVASLSPQKDVEQNLADALNFYNLWQEAGKPVGPENEKVIRDLTERAEVGMSGQVARNQLYENLVNDVQPTGPKVSNFAKNLKGNMDAVTKDRWMAYLFGNNERMFRWFKEGSPKPAVHLAADALIRAVGQSIGMLPAEVQETSWSFLRTVVNLTEKEKISPKEAIGRVNDQLIKEGASELTRLIADSPKVQSALNRLATATGDERFRADNLQNSPRFKQLLQEHADQPDTGGTINRAGAERGVKQAIKARSEISQAKKAKEAPDENLSRIKGRANVVPAGKFQYDDFQPANRQFLLSDGSMLSEKGTDHYALAKELGIKSSLDRSGAIRVAGPWEYDVLKNPTARQRAEVARVVKNAGDSTGSHKMYWSIVDRNGKDVGGTGFLPDFFRALDSAYGETEKAEPAKKAPKDKATEFNPSDLSRTISPSLSEKMKSALA